MIYFGVGLRIKRAGGDALDYLVAGYSLLKDKDVDLYNNAYHFKVHQLTDPFVGVRLDNPQPETPVPFLPPTFAVNTFSVENKLLPVHGVGLSILLAPLMITNQIWGPRLLISVIGALVGVNIYLLTCLYTDKKKALLVALVFSLSSPLAFYSNIAFIEIVAALLIVHGYRILTDRQDKSDYHLALAYLLISFLPWLHVRYLVISLAFLAFVFWQGWKVKKLNQFAFLLGLLLVSAVGQLGFIYRYYHSLTLLWKFGYLGFGNPLTGLLGLFLDREKGLLPYSPIYWLALAGLIEVIKKIKKYSLLVMLLSSFSIYFCYNEWGGGFSPPARFLVPITPLLSLPLALLAEKTKRVGTGLLVLSGLVGIYLVFVGWFKTPFTGFEDTDGQSYIFQTSPIGKRIESLFPDVQKTVRINFEDNLD